KFNAQMDTIDTFNTEILGHLIKEVRVLFARELMSSKISEDEVTIKKSKKSNEQPILEEIYFAIKVCGIVDAKVKIEQQCQLKLCKGSTAYPMFLKFSQ
ncbi:16944_t:CDS:2, partial [Funneliformis caledonium]